MGLGRKEGAHMTGGRMEKGVDAPTAGWAGLGRVGHSVRLRCPGEGQRVLRAHLTSSWQASIIKGLPCFSAQLLSHIVFTILSVSICSAERPGVTQHAAQHTMHNLNQNRHYITL